MLVTIYSDASFDPRSGLGAWATWCCRDELEPVVRSGLCAPEVRSSVQAELQAAVEGVVAAKLAWPETRHVVVQSDCRAIFAHLRGERVPRIGSVEQALRDALALADVVVRERWTRGHQRPDTVRAWLHAQCDIEARKLLRAARPAAEPGLSASQHVLRAALTRHFGSGPHDALAARRWVATMLGYGNRGVPVGALTGAECRAVMTVLGSRNAR